MKRFLLLSLGIVLSGALGLQLGQVTFAVRSSSDLVAQLFEDANLVETSSTDPKSLETLAANDEIPFENLYLFMFQNVTKGPSEAALQALEDRLKEKKRRDYSVEDLRTIAVDGSLEPIIEKWQNVASDLVSDPDYLATQAEVLAAQDAEFEAFKDANSFDPGVEQFYDWYYLKYVKGDALTQEDAVTAVPQQNILDEYKYLTNLYQSELGLQRDYRKFAYESLADEMFFNNDLGDSAKIDILSDLDAAYQILFDRSLVLPDRGGSDAISLASEPEADSVSSLPASEDSVILSSEGVSPYACFDDEALREAVDTFSTTMPTVPPSNQTEPTIVYPSASSSNPDTAVGGVSTPKQSVDEALQKLDSFITQLQGPQGDWTRSLPCGDVFCIKVNLVSDTEDPVVENNYKAGDNCVLCHLSAINQRMGETLDKSLVANKPPMNVFEDATCKEAGSLIDLDFNLYSIAMPIQLDPGDDIDDAPAAQIEDLKKTLISVGGLSLGSSSRTQYGRTLSDLECESIINLYELSDGPVSIDTANQACQVSKLTLQNQVNDAIDQIIFEAAVSNGNTLYEQAAAEFSNMLLLFQSIQEGLKATYLQDGAPLSTLVKKPYCGQ